LVSFINTDEVLVLLFTGNYKSDPSDTVAQELMCSLLVDLQIGGEEALIIGDVFLIEKAL